MAGTTTNYGWTYPTSTDLVKDGATAMQTLASAIDTTSATSNYAGLVLVKTQTIGSAVASVTVTGAFSTTYDAYKIVITGGVASTTATIALQLGSTTTNYQGVLNYANYAGSTATPAGSSGSNFQFAGSADTNANPFSAELINPFLSTQTYIESIYIATLNAGKFIGRQNSTTSFTAFTLTPSSGTLTGGTIAVYGYRKAI